MSVTLQFIVFIFEETGESQPKCHFFSFEDIEIVFPNVFSNVHVCKTVIAYDGLRYQQITN